MVARSSSSSKPPQHFPQPSWTDKKLVNNIYLLFIIVGITFVSELPQEIRVWIKGTSGTFVGVCVVLGVSVYFGWVSGLMTALLFVLAGGAGSSEGFHGGLESRKISNKKRWFVEEVLGEMPEAIEEEVVDTTAVEEDGGGSSAGRSGSNY